MSFWNYTAIIVFFLLLGMLPALARKLWGDILIVVFVLLLIFLIYDLFYRVDWKFFL